MSAVIRCDVCSDDITEYLPGAWHLMSLSEISILGVADQIDVCSPTCLLTLALRLDVAKAN